MSMSIVLVWISSLAVICGIKFSIFLGLPGDVIFAGNASQHLIRSYTCILKKRKSLSTLKLLLSVFFYISTFVHKLY
jgi:hypothetical protein